VFVLFETKNGVVLATGSNDHANAIDPSEIEIEHFWVFVLITSTTLR